MKDDRDYGQNQENVDEEGCDVEYKEAAQPQQEQKKSKPKKHLSPLSIE
jgi:hypothetical protein